LPAPDHDQFTEFVADVEPTVRRALSEEFGPEAGREATADALAFAWANWERVTAADDSAAYLVQVGHTAAERHRPLATGDVVPILPRSQAAFDALVPPVGAAAAITRAEDLLSGAPTAMLARPGAPTTVVRTSAADGAATMRLPVAPRPPADPPPRRTAVWGAAVVLAGVIALGGIALANRSEGDGGDPVDTSGLPTLPTTVPVSTTAPAAGATTVPAPGVAVTTTLPTDTLPEITAPADDGSDSGAGDDDDGSPVITAAPTSAAPTPTTEPDITLPPVTDAPITEPSVTTPPVTEPTVTLPPETSPPSTAPASTAPPRPTVPPSN
jgi:hypothetical protein